MEYQHLALVVDDEPQMLDIVTFALETQGFSALSAKDAETAWQHFRGRRFDLVVLDVMLPQASGLSLCRRIRETSDVPKTRSLTASSRAASPAITSTATPRFSMAVRIAISSSRGICSALRTISQQTEPPRPVQMTPYRTLQEGWAYRGVFSPTRPAPMPSSRDWTSTTTTGHAAAPETKHASPDVFNVPSAHS